jgi:hypothetical protein
MSFSCGRSMPCDESLISAKRSGTNSTFTTVETAPLIWLWQEGACSQLQSLLAYAVPRVELQTAVNPPRASENDIDPVRGIAMGRAHVDWIPSHKAQVVSLLSQTAFAAPHFRDSARESPAV